MEFNYYMYKIYIYYKELAN